MIPGSQVVTDSDEFRATLGWAPVTQVKITNERTSEPIESTHPCCETRFFQSGSRLKDHKDGKHGLCQEELLASAH